MRRIVIYILVMLMKMTLFYYLGLVLGLGSYDPESSMLWQNWKVYLLLYLPLAMGIEGLIVTLIEVWEENRKTEEQDD